VDFEGKILDQVVEELFCDKLCHLLMEFKKCILAFSINPDKQVELLSFQSDFRDIDMDIPNLVIPKVLLFTVTGGLTCFRGRRFVKQGYELEGEIGSCDETREDLFFFKAQ